MDANTPRRLTDDQLLQEVTYTAALAQSEIEKAFVWPEGSDLREWHLEQADAANAQLLHLINAPQHRAFWERVAAFVAPIGSPIEPSLKACARVEPEL